MSNINQLPVALPNIETKPIAAFDVDGTLTWTDSFMLFLRFTSGRSGFAYRLVGLLPTFLRYLLRLQSRDETKNQLMTAFLKGMSLKRYEKWCVDFAACAYPLIVRPDAIARLNNHLGVRDEVVLVSASLEDYLQPFAHAIGANGVVATQVEVFEGVLTGRMKGPNCRCAQKVSRLQARFETARVVAAYGDSAGDKELLQAAEVPGYRVFNEAPARRQAVLWDLYMGTLLERRFTELGL